MSKKNNIYSELDEGMGGAYERIAYTNVLKELAQAYGCKSFLELDATYIAGIPGFNSCLLAQSGYDTYVAVQERDLADTEKVWAMTKLREKVEIHRIDTALHTQFEDNQIDIVWNHLSFEQYRHPEKLVAEMKRVSNKLIINLTLNPFNYGYLIHRISHIINREKWNHGYMLNSTIEAVKKAHRKLGLEVIGFGACDAPPWMDTVNAVIGNSMTYADILPGKAREQWVWCSCNPDCQNHWLTKLFLSWEEQMPLWFKILASHHLWVASKKVES